MKTRHSIRQERQSPRLLIASNVVTQTLKFKLIPKELIKKLPAEKNDHKREYN